VIVLAFDTATPDTVVGLATGDGEVAEARHSPAPGERPGHAEQLLRLAAQLAAGAGLRLADVQRIGVGVGPGTFTGLRIGVATARALAQAGGAELVTVGTLDALVEGARAGGHEGPVLACLDARRGEAFVATQAARGASVSAPAAVRPEDLAAHVTPGTLAAGDGAIRFREQLEPAGASVPPDGSGLHRVGAAALCRLAAAAAPADRDSVVPEYVRPPDAVPRQHRNG
jgi:tRNA threonylcarbamoyladenosine biosynthesis protein TsaB